MSAVPHGKQMSMFMQDQHQQISQQLSLVSSLPHKMTQDCDRGTDSTHRHKLRSFRSLLSSLLLGRQNDSLTQAIKSMSIIHIPSATEKCYRLLVRRHAAGALCGAVGSGAALQAERSRVRFTMVSLEFLLS